MDHSRDHPLSPVDHAASREEARAEAASALAIATALLFVPVASAQTQIWANLTFDRVKSDRLIYELDFEPKALVNPAPGETGWKNLDITPSTAFSATEWVDLTAELTTGFTRQTDDLSSVEVTPRVGAEFHFLSRLLAKREHQPRRRLALANYLRIEWRNFFYGDSQPSASSWRFRNRLGGRLALNRQKYSDDGTYSLIADFEWFLPLSDPDERYSNRRRFRTGVGYRHSFNWRFEALYMWTLSRDTLEIPFKRSESIFDMRVKRVF